jgi:hypothetical protein
MGKKFLIFFLKPQKIKKKFFPNFEHQKNGNKTTKINIGSSFLHSLLACPPPS